MLGAGEAAWRAAGYGALRGAAAASAPARAGASQGTAATASRRGRVRLRAAPVRVARRFAAAAADLCDHRCERARRGGRRRTDEGAAAAAAARRAAPVRAPRRRRGAPFRRRAFARGLPTRLRGPRRAPRESERPRRSRPAVRPPVLVKYDPLCFTRQARRELFKKKSHRCVVRTPLDTPIFAQLEKRARRSQRTRRTRQVVRMARLLALAACVCCAHGLAGGFGAPKKPKKPKAKLGGGLEEAARAASAVRRRPVPVLLGPRARRVLRPAARARGAARGARP